MRHEYTDAETGFVYLRARYYDPLTGQFISRDPLVALTGSAYGYVGGDPLNGTDPSGLSKCGQFSLGGLVDCAAKAGRNAAATAKVGAEAAAAVVTPALQAGVNVAASAERDVEHWTIDAVTDPFYLAYWGALDLNGAIHCGLSSAFGRTGSDIADVLGAPLVPIQAVGLGVDVGGDWLKEHLVGVPHYTVGDEGIPDAYLLGSQVGPIAQHVGINWRHKFPGVHRNGKIDWRW